MTPGTLLVAVALLPGQTPRPFAIPPSDGLTAVHRLAAQADVDVAVHADLAGRRSPGLRGRLTTPEAFERLLAPLGARAVRLSDRLYRIEPAPARSPAPARRFGPRPPAAPPPVVSELDEVVVTAPVQRGGLDGANGRSLLGPDRLRRFQGRPGGEALADLSATVDSTRQGPGRNKLFIRGVADSAFNGPLQATVGQYLGDLRLNYGSPDPDLVLVDMARVEVFEGPQGSRFGSASIGGVVRYQPNAPVPGETRLETSAGVSATSGGAPGTDATLVLNRGFGPDAALRLVAHARREGGFVDNPVRGVRNRDALDVHTLRGAARWTGADWTVDVTALTQALSTADAPSVSTESDGPVKARAVAEPYDSRLAVIGATARRAIPGGRLTAAVSVSRQSLEERFDATPPGDARPAAVDRRQRIGAVSVEGRADWAPGRLWSWNGGVAVAAGRTRSDRTRHVLGEPELRLESVLSRRFAEAALFAEGVAHPSDALSLAFGGRLSIGYASHRFTPAAEAVAGWPHRSGEAEVVFTPTAAVRWRPAAPWTLFARFERGVRPGAVAEARGVVEPIRGDRVTLLEAGARWTDPDRGVSAEASAGWLDWRDVQADRITEGGDLVTGNVGDGEVAFVQLKAAWEPAPTVSLTGSLFLNESRLRLDGLSTIGVTEGPVPNVAEAGAQISLEHEPGPLLGRPVRLSADLRFVGESRPGLGPALDVPQGDYWSTDLSARWGDDRRSWVLRIGNPQDDWAIRFGATSPYQLGSPQGTPMRPVAVRLGLEAAF